MERFHILSAPRWRRRGTGIRILVAAILVLCFFFFPSSPRRYSGPTNEATTRAPLSPREENVHTPRTKDIDLELLRAQTKNQEPTVRDELPLIKHSGSGEYLLKPAKEDADTIPHSNSNLADSTIDLDKVRAALVSIISLHPGENKVEDLLSSFRGTGPEKLRDVSGKTRAFKAYFEAWEALHLVIDDHGVHIRNDVLRFIRDNHEDLNLPESSLAKTLRSYESFRYLVSSLADMLFSWTTPYFASHMNLHASLYKAGRGIVLSAGEDQVPYLLATIPAMRQLGCDLPIEVMYLGDEDISEEYRDELEKITGVVTRDMKQMVWDNGWELKGWAAKPFAMLLSSFKEVMFIDADAVFFRNPALLFEDPQYQKTGALFFKDRSLFPESKRRWLKSILPKPISKSVQRSRLWTGESGHQQESGVILVDKWRHFVEMLLVTRMNGPDRDGNEAEGIEGIYDMVYGDKETFWLAWELLNNRDYAFHEGYRGTMGQLHHGPISLEVPKSPSVIYPAVTESDATENDPVLQGSGPTETQDSERSSKKVKAAPVNGQNTHRPTTPDFVAKTHSNPLSVNEPTHQISKQSIPENLELDTAKELYTICAPQLLHLDAEGRPLWLNGWIARNKYKDPSQSIPGIFEVYIMEPPMASKTDAWRLRDNNVACLTADVVTKFTKQERDVLDMVTGFAKDVGALGGQRKDGKVHVYL